MYDVYAGFYGYVFYPLMGYAMEQLGDNTVVPTENPY